MRPSLLRRPPLPLSGMKEETDQPKDNQVSSYLKDLSAVIFVTFNNIMEYEIENQPHHNGPLSAV